MPQMDFYFENVKVYCSKIGPLKNRAAIAIPDIGIFINPKDRSNIDLLRHEFGHILQRRQSGLFYFYSKIALTSIMSARKANRNKNYNHMNCWTEWTANKLAYNYFNCPADWNFKEYPIDAASSLQKK